MLRKFLTQLNLKEYAAERRRTTLNMEVSFVWESDVVSDQNGRSFSRNISSEMKRMFEKCMR